MVDVIVYKVFNMALDIIIATDEGTPGRSPENLRRILSCLLPVMTPVQ
jgi:hypothetical protein